MDFFDKLAIALFLWGIALTLAGAMKLDFVEYRPAVEHVGLRRKWSRVLSLGIALLCAASITWMAT
jgi:hypothetical protein